MHLFAALTAAVSALALGAGALGAADADAPTTAPTGVPRSDAPGPLSQAPWVAPASVPEGVERLASALWRQLPRGRNLAISPCSIHACLAMASAGARGETLAQMRRAVELPAAEVLDRGWKDTAAALRPTGGDAPAWRWDMANHLFVQEGFPLCAPFVHTLAGDYGSVVTPVDFAGHAAAAIATINRWCDVSTEHMVPAIISDLSADTRVVLADAVFFDAAWQDPFEQGRSAPGPFHRGVDGDARVTFMHGERMCLADRLDGASVVALPYARSQLEAVLIVPAALDGLAGIEARLDAAELARVLACPRTQRSVTLALPRMHLATDIMRLRGPLETLGMRDAFLDGRADFSGISGQPLHIGEVVHRCVIDLDERGTVAAAATAMSCDAGEPPPMAEAMTVIADHPFLLAIRHRPSGTILFLARIADPSA